MSFETIARIPKVFFFVFFLLLILSLLFISGSPLSKNAKEASIIGAKGAQVQGEQTTKIDIEKENDGVKIEDIEKEEHMDIDSDNSSFSSHTKINVNVSSSNTNENTTGSANISVTSNGNHTNFDGSLEKCMAEGKVRIRSSNSEFECDYEDSSLEIEWESDVDLD